MMRTTMISTSLVEGELHKSEIITDERDFNIFRTNQFYQELGQMTYFI